MIDYLLSDQKILGGKITWVYSAVELVTVTENEIN